MNGARNAESSATPDNADLATSSEEVTFASSSLTLRGTLTLPSAPGPASGAVYLDRQRRRRSQQRWQRAARLSASCPGRRAIAAKRCPRAALRKFSSSRFCLTQRRKVTKLKMARFVFLSALCESRELLKLAHGRSGRSPRRCHGRRSGRRCRGCARLSARARGILMRRRSVFSDTVKAHRLPQRLQPPTRTTLRLLLLWPHRH